MLDRVQKLANLWTQLLDPKTFYPLKIIFEKKGYKFLYQAKLKLKSPVAAGATMLVLIAALNFAS